MQNDNEPEKSTMTKSSEVEAKKQPTGDKIRFRAYEIYLSRGGEPGHEIEDWLQAEKELKAKYDKI